MLLALAQDDLGAGSLDDRAATAGDFFHERDLGLGPKARLGLLDGHHREEPALAQERAGDERLDLERVERRGLAGERALHAQLRHGQGPPGAHFLRGVRAEFTERMAPDDVSQPAVKSCGITRCSSSGSSPRRRNGRRRDVRREGSRPSSGCRPVG